VEVFTNRDEKLFPIYLSKDAEDLDRHNRIDGNEVSN